MNHFLLALIILAVFALVWRAEAPRPLIRWAFFLAAAISLACGPPFGVAFAQAAPAPGGASSISFGPIFQIFAPYILDVASVVVTSAIAIAAAAFQRWTKVQIDQKHRDALHSAAMTGLHLAMSKLGVTANSITVDVKSPLVAQAIVWMERSAPDALARFKMTPDKLAAFVEGKLSQIANSNTPAPAILVAPATAVAA